LIGIGPRRATHGTGLRSFKSSQKRTGNAAPEKLNGGANHGKEKSWKARKRGPAPKTCSEVGSTSSIEEKDNQERGKRVWVSSCKRTIGKGGQVTARGMIKNALSAMLGKRENRDARKWHQAWQGGENFFTLEHGPDRDEPGTCKGAHLSPMRAELNKKKKK